MKYIKKGDSPAKFEQWKIDFKDRTGREPVYLDLKGSIKRDLKETLLKEQGYICCYCMCRIAAYDSHIEHFIARSEAKDRPYSVVVQDAELGYENLLLSCEGEEGDGGNDGTGCHLLAGGAGFDLGRVRRDAPGGAEGDE